MDFRPLMTLRLTTAPVQTGADGPHGQRLTYPITGGDFEGAQLRGVVLPGGGDRTVLRPDGMLEVDLRITLRTDDDALISMTFVGLRQEALPAAKRGRRARADPADVYFRTLPRFETAAPRYALLNQVLAVGTGELRADGPVHVIEEIL